VADITQLILDDHEWFRRRFAELDDLRAEGAEPSALRAVWRPLADLLDVHAEAEERIFYPQLLRKGANDPEEETLDAIGDHNDIRDAIRRADAAAVGTAAWWAGVNAARAANTEHMAEEEDDALADYRRNSDAAARRELGRAFLQFKATHRTAAAVDTSDKDPEAYVAAQLPAHDPSLRIGSLR
jgi:hypothetical protein